MHGFPRRVIVDVGEKVGVSAGPGLLLLLARALVLLTEGAFQLGPHSCRDAAPVAPPRVRHRRRARVNILRSRRPQVVPLTLELLLGPVRRQPARGEKDLRRAQDEGQAGSRPLARGGREDVLERDAPLPPPRPLVAASHGGVAAARCCVAAALEDSTAFYSGYIAWLCAGAGRHRRRNL